jgi:hypothetical protein
MGRGPAGRQSRLTVYLSAWPAHLTKLEQPTGFLTHFPVLDRHVESQVCSIQT